MGEKIGLGAGIYKINNSDEIHNCFYRVNEIFFFVILSQLIRECHNFLFILFPICPRIEQPSFVFWGWSSPTGFSQIL